MSTIYTGNPANVTTPLAATVTATTGAAVAPIVITTVANHLYATNDLVTVSGVTGNTAANGAWTIIVLSPTTFSLTGTTGNGAYAGGGTCSDNSLTPQFTIPSDGDAMSASSINVPYQALADRTQYLALRLPSRSDTLTSAAGTWACPPGVLTIEVFAFGGGGGGCGGDIITPTTRSAIGGGGGGGSKRAITITRLVVTPGAVFNYVNGAGGAPGGGGSAGGVGTPGGDGGDSSFAGVVVARGGGGGNCSALATAAAGNFVACPGGRSPRSVAAAAQMNPSNGFSSLTAFVIQAEAQDGGQGGTGSTAIGQLATDGGCSPEGFAGGALGAPGNTSTNRGGGGGGGGGAGPAGIGGAGGAGGAGTAAGTGGSAPANSIGNPAANTGAGGSGGGGGGQGTTTGGAGSPGQSGGSGQMWIVYSGPQATFT